MVDGLRRVGCEVRVVYWSAHRQSGERLAAKVRGRSRDLLAVRAATRAWRPDVMYVASSHNWPAMLRDVPLALSTAMTGPPFVLHFHGSECGKLGQPGQTVFTALSRWLARRAAAVLLLSVEEVQTWRRLCPRARFELVLNPFVPMLVEGPGPSASARVRDGKRPPTILFVGRLVRDKGVFELLDAFGIVRRTHPCRLSLAGEGPAEADVVQRVTQLDLAEEVELLGYVSGDALERAYRSADVFALPSYREGFPLVVMEAMGYGLPVVTTPIRGCADHLAPGVNALFAPPRDVEALAERLLRLLDDGALRRRMGAANVEKVRDFAPEVVVPRYGEILRSVARVRRDQVG
jgi:glycosyltransferase involved in cell wall biosynthesis